MRRRKSPAGRGEGGFMELKTKECPKCGWGRLGERKKFPVKRKDPVFSEEEIMKLIRVAVIIFYDSANQKALKNCPHCEVLLEDVPREK